MKKRAFSFLLGATLLLLPLTNGSAGMAYGATVPHKTLQQHGQDVISVINEMVRSDTYPLLMSAGPEMNDVVALIRQGEYTQPKAVYKISIPQDFKSLLPDTLEIPDLSPVLQQELKNRLQASLTSQINGQAGVGYLTSSLIYTSSKLFVSQEATQDTIYLYCFEKGFPILVTFTVGEDFAVHASGTYLLNPEFTTSSAQEIEKALNEIYFSTGYGVELLATQ